MTVRSKRRKISLPKRSKHSFRSRKSQKKVRLAIECTATERRRIKTLAALEDKTITEVVLESVKMRFPECTHSHVPNAETEKAMRDIEEGRDLTEFSSTKELFKSLGIKC